jgi:cobalt-precorrin 5A hydrolase / precorrin-3B C17-methyltransferase
MVAPAIFIIGPSAFDLALTLRERLNGEIHGPENLPGCDAVYVRATSHLVRLFEDGRTIVGLCAAGILIRALGPHLADKLKEPPVIAVAEDGSSVVPLLGGHHGANDLARDIAKLVGGHAAITTASDVRLGKSFDEPDAGHVLSPLSNMKEATAARLRGEPVQVEITELIPSTDTSRITYHPLTLVIGVGCERGTSREEVSGLIKETLQRNKLAVQSVAGFASIDIKEDEPAIAALHNVSFFTANELNAFAPQLKTPSDIVMAEVGTPGVAESASLAGAGPGAELIVPKVKSKRATVAIARAPKPLLQLYGRSKGNLAVIGIGPGDKWTRSPQAVHQLDLATDWVGYGLYLDLAADLRTDQKEHRFPLGGEEDRVRHAIALAKQGKQVALICSGDAGIYAMAALVYEVIDKEPCRVGVEVIPGISAFQAAAAKAGAMIGHDFCCISLSDLLTPWPDIERRIKAAAEGDFVISFYNPRSLKRRDQIERAMEILKPWRPGETPVVIASELGRPKESVRIIRFDEFNPEDVDMLTLVMVGSSQSRAFKRGDGKTYAYTPRGYAAKGTVG